MTGGTTEARLEHLIATNHRLRSFLSRVSRHGWKPYPSRSAWDCIIVAPREDYSDDDHFVLYPSGEGRRSSLQVYDGRRGREFAPIAARNACAWIASI